MPINNTLMSERPLALRCGYRFSGATFLSGAIGTSSLKYSHVLLVVLIRLLSLEKDEPEMDEQEIVSVASAKKPRFSSVCVADIRQAEDARVPSSTKQETAFWMRVLKPFCEETGASINLTTCLSSDLNELLCRFYLGVRIRNGQYYKRSSYLPARAAISRHVVVEPKRPELNLFREAVFRQSNHVLDQTGS